MEKQPKSYLPIYGAIVMFLIMTLAVIALVKINTQAAEMKSMAERLILMEARVADINNAERLATEAKNYSMALAKQTQQLTERVNALEVATRK